MSDLTEKRYFDQDGNPRSLFEMMRIEPDWMLSRYRYMETRIESLESALRDAWPLMALKTRWLEKHPELTRPKQEFREGEVVARNPYGTREGHHFIAFREDDDSTNCRKLTTTEAGVQGLIDAIEKGIKNSDISCYVHAAPLKEALDLWNKERE